MLNVVVWIYSGVENIELSVSQEIGESKWNTEISQYP